MSARRQLEIGLNLPAWPGWLRPSRIASLIPFVLFLILFIKGLPYFQLPMAERVRSPLHLLFRPSGLIGQTAGIIAFSFFIFLWLYPIRKRFRWLAFTGSISQWLSVHIVAGLSIPMIAGLHAGWRFNGLAGLCYISMFIVVLSGIVGRFIYSQIPRSRSGLALSLDEIRARGDESMLRIVATTGIQREELRKSLGFSGPTAARPGLWQTIPRMIGNNLERSRRLQRLRREWAGRVELPADAVAAALRLARQQIALEQQLELLDATQRIFRFWHTAHMPFAVTALVTVLIHVAVAIVMGVTWVR